MNPHRLIDLLPCSPSISRLRALKIVDENTVSTEVFEGVFTVGVVLRKFPNGGSWSFYVCPACGGRARVLRLHEGPKCWACCTRLGFVHRAGCGTVLERAEERVARIARLRAKLEGGPARLHPRPWVKLDRRRSLEASLARAEISLRRAGLR